MTVPLDDNNKPALAGYDPIGHQVASTEMVNVTTDPSTGTRHGALNVNTTIAGPAATDPYQATVFAGGALRVQEDPTQLFYCAFDVSTLDTANVWKTPTAAGGGVAATNALTNTQIGSGTTANGYSYLESQTTFQPRSPGWLLVQTPVNVEFPVVINSYRFWGLGTSPATPTAAAPLTNACGFELAITGKMYAVTYQSGNRVVIADLSSSGNSKQPLDANVHLYSIYFRGDRIFYCIDGLDNVVAQTVNGAPGPDVNILPLKFTSIASTTPPVSSCLLQVNAVFVGDTARNNFQISDYAYPWRKATVDAFGNLRTADQIRALIANGQGFRATTTIITTGAVNAFVGFLARAQNLGVNVVIYNVSVVSSGSGPDGRIYQNTTGANVDAGLTTNLLTSNTANQIVGGASPLLSVLSGSPASTTQTTGMGGTGAIQPGVFGVSANASFVILLNSAQIWLPKNTDRNASMYLKVPTSGATASFMIEWVEF
jgi:hypothetical protein